MSWAATALLAVSVWAEPADWLRIYPLTPYREFWTLQVDVKSLSRDLPRVMQALEKQQAQLTVPLANSVSSPSAGTQQLTYRLTQRRAAAALKALKTIGSCAPPSVRPAGELIPLEEIKHKIAALSRDKQAHESALASMPAVSALTEAVLGHLITAQAVAENSDPEVVLNLTLQERGKH